MQFREVSEILGKAMVRLFIFNGNIRNKAIQLLHGRVATRVCEIHSCVF